MDIPEARFTVGTRWRECVDRIQDYSVIRDGNVFRTSFADSYLFTSEYERALALRERLLAEHDGISITDLFDGQEVETGSGTCYEIRSSCPFTPGTRNPGSAYERLVADLTLIPGIGPVTAHRLTQRGYHSIADLISHPRHRKDARAFLDLCERREVSELLAWLMKRGRRSQSQVLDTADFIPTGKLLFLDIETLGLFSRPIILFGTGRIRGSTMEVHQYLLRDIKEEPAALAAVLESAGDRGAYVTYNGKCFDIPYMQERAVYYGMPLSGALPHYDLLHFARRGLRNRVPDCRLTTLERHIFNHSRTDDVPSQLVPEFYATYLATGNPGPLVPVVSHNRQDIVSLAQLFQYLREGLRVG
ncbi:MAG: ribonuclease H-like domain-containing protein, partial [Methanomicrobiales archaeon]|nr:ribonuclease H-like domain-containing protein [Methanomicrobiales archaeon]